MRNVLIVDDERQFIESLLVGLGDYEDVFHVTAAADGQEAIGILNRTRVDLVVTDLRMPRVNGFELLAHLSSHYPSIPAFVLSAYASGKTEEKLAKMGTVRFFEKPVDFDQLVVSILNVFDKDFESGSLSGVSVGSFIQLVELENKTCLLKIEKGKYEKGYFYFNRGALYDAVCRGLKGEEAAIEMIGWENVRITFKAIPVKKIARRIRRNVVPLIMEAVDRSKTRPKRCRKVDREKKSDAVEAKTAGAAADGSDKSNKKALKKHVLDVQGDNREHSAKIAILGGIRTKKPPR